MGLLFIFFAAVNVLFIIAIVSGLKKSKKTINKIPSCISVVVPFRNEEKNLPLLVDQLLSLGSPVTRIILADDHSEDRSGEIAKGYAERNGDIIEYISTKKTGKKEALREGIISASSEWIITLDADTTLKNEWLSSLFTLSMNKEPELICGPVVIKGSSFFDKIQSMDLLAMVAAGMGLGRMGRPFICNGCNMAFRKKTWLDLMNGHSSLSLAGGDDVFFLHRLVAEKGTGSVYFNWSEAAAVQTNGVSGIKEFFMQRIRWGNKSVHYENRTGILISAFVLLNALVSLVGLTIVFFYPPLRVFALIYLMCRLVSDFLLLFLACRKMNEKRIISYFPVAFLFHQVYVPLVAISAIVIKPRWKGRVV